MKLLHCERCGDVVRLYSFPRYCHCRNSSGYYVNDTHVRVAGPNRVIGIDTGELKRNKEGTWHVSDRIDPDELQREKARRR